MAHGVVSVFHPFPFLRGICLRLPAFLFSAEENRVESLLTNVAVKARSVLTATLCNGDRHSQAYKLIHGD